MTKQELIEHIEYELAELKQGPRGYYQSNEELEREEAYLNGKIVVYEEMLSLVKQL